MNRLVTCGFTLLLRIRDHTRWFWRCVGTAFGHVLLGSQKLHGRGSWPVCEVALRVGLDYGEEVHQWRIWGEHWVLTGHGLHYGQDFFRWRITSMDEKNEVVVNMATLLDRGVLRRSSCLGNLKPLVKKLGLWRAPTRGNCFYNIFHLAHHINCCLKQPSVLGKIMNRSVHFFIVV